MEKLASLDFSNPNNACQSLRVLAEWVRAGDVICGDEDPAVGRDIKDFSPEMVLGFKEGK